MCKNKFKPMEIVVYDPQWNKEYMRDYDWTKSEIGRREAVIFMGNIPNAPGHCVVSKFNGQIFTMMHPEDFRRAKESEL
jgi:hypothetical protein